MDFSYPETHTELHKLSLEVLSDFTDPERLKKLEAHGPYFDKELWGQLIETGIATAAFPETLGGMELDFSSTCLVADSLGQTVASIPYIPCIVSTALPLLDIEAAKPLLEQIASGELIATTAFIEPGNENTLQPATTVSDNKLNGSKHCVPYAADAGQILLTANNNGELWIGLVNTSAAGVTITEQKTTANEPQYQVSFDNAEAQTLATGDEAKALAQKSIAMTTIAYCNMAGGLAFKMTRIGGEYTSQRKQFGVPLATFQAVAHRLADCYIDTECLKIITLKASSDVNNGDYDADSLSMAKAWCGDALFRVSQAAQHVHGGMGIDRDYHLFRYCLWAKQLELSLGHSKYHIAKLADRIEQRYLQAAAS